MRSFSLRAALPLLLQLQLAAGCDYYRRIETGDDADIACADKCVRLCATGRPAFLPDSRSRTQAPCAWLPRGPPVSDSQAPDPPLTLMQRAFEAFPEDSKGRIMATVLVPTTCAPHAAAAAHMMSSSGA